MSYHITKIPQSDPETCLQFHGRWGIVRIHRQVAIAPQHFKKQ